MRDILMQQQFVLVFSSKFYRPPAMRKSTDYQASANKEFAKIKQPDGMTSLKTL